MDNKQNNQVAVIRSINSTDMMDQTQKEIARIPPVPPPKPKINVIKNAAEATNKVGENSKVLNVRQAILKGSKNPTGLSCGEPFAYIPPNQETSSPLGGLGMEFPKLQINSLSTRSSIISNEERDANLDIIFSDWGSQTFADKVSNFQSKNENCAQDEPPKITKASSHEPIFSPKSSEIKYDQSSLRHDKNEVKSSGLKAGSLGSHIQDKEPDIIKKDIKSSGLKDVSLSSPTQDNKPNIIKKDVKSSGLKDVSLSSPIQDNKPNIIKKDVKSSGLKADSHFQDKKPDVIKDSEYLFPRLEKQSNQIVVLAENNPTELKDDIIRNCDVVEESVPEIGHTGNLLKYWQKVEASPEKENKIVNNKHNFIPDDVTIWVSQPPKEKQEKKFPPLDHEQVLNDILQEFESFNKDILDLNVEPEATKEPNLLDNHAGDAEAAYTLSNYDFLSTTGTADRNKELTTPINVHPQGEEGVYYELDTDKISNDFSKPPDIPAQEFNTTKTEPEKQVTLIGFRKLNDDEQDSNSIRSSPSITHVEGIQSSNDSPKEDTTTYSQDDEKTSKKKTASKQKCMVM